MRCLLAVFLTLLVGPLALVGQQASGEGSAAPAEKAAAADQPVAAALKTVFSPARAPQRKTMGLLQRSFLDLADQGDQELEIAIVVDGTDSMAAELEGVRESIGKMLEDLRRYRDNEVRVAFVVYRDAGSPSGEVVIPLASFTNDPALMATGIEALMPESGAPFFHELPDLGIHKALTELPWSEDDQVAKWILLFGDAPPYAESYRDAQTPQAYRRFATPILVAMAKQKNIRINCVLCTSSDDVREPYQQVVDETRAFMSLLASGTDGLMLDLSYEDIRDAIVQASRQPEVGLAALEPITEVDLAAVRRVEASAEARSVRLAVLPHLPLNQMSFDPRQPAVQIATAIRSTLAKIPGVYLASPRDIKEQLRRLRSQGMEDRQAMRGLAAMLGVDFVVWGSIAPDQATIRTAAYRGGDGQAVFPLTLDRDRRHQANPALKVIQVSAAQSPSDPSLAALLQRIQAMESAIGKPLAKTPATHDELMTAMEALDQALAFEAGEDESAILLAEADAASRNALTAEPLNPWAHWLQANIAYNLALREFRKGNPAVAERHLANTKQSMSEAVQNRQQLSDASLVTEIEADYYLMVQRQPEQAIERYEKMIDSGQPLASQLRGHWMLAGIRAGDWGLAESAVVDASKARYHIVQILANWPDSPEAKLLKKWLRWDETKRETEFNYLPTVHVIET